MLKVISLIKRRDDLPLEEFRRWALERHAPKGKELPGLREYRMSVVERDDSIAGTRVAPFLTEGLEGFSIDYPDDWRLAEEAIAGIGGLAVISPTPFMP